MTPPHRPRPSLAARLAALLVGLVLALGLGELLATWAMDGGYPTLNLYVPDARFGVRLEPHATTRVSSPLGTLTDYRTNADGLRGDDLPPPAAATVPGRLLIVGDSQVMGWGVPEAAAFPRRLAALSGAEIIAVGLPTWGPHEYALAVADLVPRLRPERVLVVLNTTNDWVEAPVPNVRRTTARNGWARNVDVAPDPADPAVTPDGGALERWLLGRSHLVLALRLAFDPPRPKTLPSRLPLRLFDERARLAAPSPPYRSKVTPHLLAAREVARRYGAALVPVVIPMDVEVDPAAWAKYGLAARDPAPLRAFVAGLVADLPETVDLHEALAASPAAFLPDDDHLSAAGHEAVARALIRPPSEARP